MFKCFNSSLKDISRLYYQGLPVKIIVTYFFKPRDSRKGIPQTDYKTNKTLTLVNQTQRLLAAKFQYFGRLGKSILSKREAFKGCAGLACPRKSHSLNKKCQYSITFLCLRVQIFCVIIILLFGVDQHKWITATGH